jgi:bifunctional DNase/RNase
VSSPKPYIYCREFYSMDDFISVNVKGVYLTKSFYGRTPLVIISGEDGRIMPIYVGMSEAVSISTALNNEITPRPMTHDLMTTIIERLGASINDILIDEIKEGIYYARLILSFNGSILEIDARPSDCISLAVRTESPIKVHKSVYDLSVIQEDELDDLTLSSFP